LEEREYDVRLSLGGTARVSATSCSDALKKAREVLDLTEVSLYDLQVDPNTSVCVTSRRKPGRKRDFSLA